MDDDEPPVLVDHRALAALAALTLMIGRAPVYISMQNVASLGHSHADANWIPEGKSGLAVALFLGGGPGYGVCVHLDTFEELSEADAKLRGRIIRYCEAEDIPYKLMGTRNQRDLPLGRR